jgi:DNA-binding winged helix-turn-helix (wHTH) protein
MIERAPIHHGKLKFGVFDVDLSSGDLRKSGIRIKLQTQPFKLLTILLSQPGEVVTREELRQQIWGAETVVNFDHSLGTAVNKVREALGDSAEHPRYIETLSKRGYRFIFPVEVVRNPTAESTLPMGEAAAGVEPPQAPPRDISFRSAIEANVVPARQPTLRPWLSGKIQTIALSVATALLLVGGMRLWPGKSQAPTILPFTQITSSDAIFPGDIGVEKFSTLLTDGARLYFSKIENGKVVIAYSAISGGEVHTLVAPSEIPAPALADISPDGSKLLVVDQDLPDGTDLMDCTHVRRRGQKTGQRAGTRRRLDAGWKDNPVRVRTLHSQYPERWTETGFTCHLARNSILVARFAGWNAGAVHGDRIRHAHHFVMGTYAERRQAAAIAALLERPALGMLRQLDARRQVVHLSIEWAGGK